VNIKYQISNIKYSNGYTLIELLAVMFVMVTVGLIVATILVSALRGTNKTNTIDTIRKNGNYTILQVSKMLEFAQSFGGVSTNGTTYTTDCSIPSTRYSYIKIISFDNMETIFSCNMSSSPATISSGSASLINTSEVLLTQCYFTCSRNITVPPTIGINFILSQKNANAPFEKRETINFQTSVILRNLNK